MTDQHTSIYISATAEKVLSRGLFFMELWLPGGSLDGNNYTGLDPNPVRPKRGVLSVNISTGSWSSFATPDTGDDLISLYAYLKDISQDEAAKILDIMVDTKWPEEQGTESAAKVNQPPKPVSEKAPKLKAEIKKDPWFPLTPIPDDACQPPTSHFARGIPRKVWSYRDANSKLIGYMCLFLNKTGGKEIIPLCFCENEENGQRKWFWRGFSEPRPMYGLDRLALYPEAPVLLVEGEKCADVSSKPMFGYILVSWPGGVQGVDKVCFKPLLGRKITAWADCDAHHQKITPQQRKDGVDPSTRPLMPESEQPGMRAMMSIKRKLCGIDGKTNFKFVDIPSPGQKPSGWDIADAAEEMDQDQLEKFIKKTRNTIIDPKRVVKNDPQFLTNNGKIVSCLANIYDVLKSDPDWDGVLGFDRFAHIITKLKPPPFGGQCGEWDDNDDTHTAMWLTRKYLFAPSPGQVSEAVESLAKENGFHPVQNYLNGLAWDGVKRVDHWINDYIGTHKTPYTMRVSRWYMMGMVARVMNPGVKFDYCLVLEGNQGRKKSMMLKVLGGEWFGDTDLDLQNKDCMNTIRGKWLYEFAEMFSIARSESPRQKSFLSSQVDNFRPPYGRRDIRSPRQVVFAGTTNEWTWNKDETGGRRFWPITCEHEIDCVGLAAARDQLFAEALMLYRLDKKFWPNAEEQRQLFDPEQIKRHQEDVYIDLLHDWVKDRYDLFCLADAADHLKIDPARLTRDIQTRIGKALRALNCTRKEKRTNVTRYWYQSPKKIKEIAPGVTTNKVTYEDFDF